MFEKKRPKVYSGCTACKKPYLKYDPDKKKEVPRLSEFPFCVRCLNRRYKDPEFNKWIDRQIRDHKGYRHNARNIIKP